MVVESEEMVGGGRRRARGGGWRSVMDGDDAPVVEGVGRGHGEVRAGERVVVVI